MHIFWITYLNMYSHFTICHILTKLQFKFLYIQTGIGIVSSPWFHVLFPWTSKHQHLNLSPFPFPPWFWYWSPFQFHGYNIYIQTECKGSQLILDHFLTNRINADAHVYKPHIQTETAIFTHMVLCIFSHSSRSIFFQWHIQAGSPPDEFLRKTSMVRTGG